MSGFPIKKTLYDFDFSFQPSINKRQNDELAAGRGKNPSCLSDRVPQHCAVVNINGESYRLKECKEFKGL